MDKPKDADAWGWYNFGILIGTERTRSDAIKAVERHTGHTWKKAKEYMQIHKVKICAL